MHWRHEMAERATTTPQAQAQAVEALAFLTGVYLAASPWIAGFNGLSTLAVNNLIVGIAYALLLSGGFGRLRTHAQHGVGRLCPGRVDHRRSVGGGR